MDSSTQHTTEELEQSIEKQKLIKLLDRVISKAKVALCLPMLTEECAHVLPYYLNSEEIKFVMECANYPTFPDPPSQGIRYKQGTIEETLMAGSEINRDRLVLFQDEHPGFPPIPEPFANFQELKRAVNMKENITDRAEPLSLLNRKDSPEVSRAIKILHSKPLVRKFVKEHLIKGITPAGKTFLQYLTYMRNMMSERLSVSQATLLERQNMLLRCWKEDQKLIKEIALLEEQLEKITNDHSVSTQNTNELLKTYQANIAMLIHHNEEDIARRIVSSEKTMCVDTKAMETEVESLETELRDLKDAYEAMLQEHVNREKELRAKKIKVESQLRSILEKYDNDMSDRQAEIDALTDEFNDELEQMRELRERFDEQEEEYEVAMAQKAAEERAVFEDKMYAFLMNRAARRIQRAWRAYWARKMERKKAKRARRKSKKGRKNKKK